MKTGIELIAEERQEQIDRIKYSEKFFYLDLSDDGYWLIKTKDGKRYTAGLDKQKAQSLIQRLNEAHRPNIHQENIHEILVCWTEHEKYEECNYVREI